MPKQLSLLKDPRSKTKLWWIVKGHAYGGSLEYRKVKRPFDSKKLVHAVFKAKLGSAIWFTRSQKSIATLLGDVAKRYNVKIKTFAINKDHIHILFYTKSRDSQTLFLRLFAAEMGRKYKAIRKKFGKSSSEFWVARPFTRLVSWGRRSLTDVCNYIEKNRLETLGFIEYSPRKHRLDAFLREWQQRISAVIPTD